MLKAPHRPALPLASKRYRFLRLLRLGGREPVRLLPWIHQNVRFGRPRSVPQAGTLPDSCTTQTMKWRGESGAGAGCARVLSRQQAQSQMGPVRNAAHGATSRKGAGTGSRQPAGMTLQIFSSQCPGPLQG